MGIEQLKGKVLTGIVGLENGSDRATFTTSEGEQFVMYHSQDCCESVAIEDVIGDVNDLIDSPILEAEEVHSADDPEDQKGRDYYDSHTWTFYKLGTIKGHVTVRWLGESNGYYSEGVDFEKIVE